MPDEAFDLDAFKTIAFSTVRDPVGSEVARMLRLAADEIEHVGARIRHIAAEADERPHGPVLHPLFWIDAGDAGAADPKP